MFRVMGLNEIQKPQSIIRFWKKLNEENEPKKMKNKTFHFKFQKSANIP